MKKQYVFIIMIIIILYISFLIISYTYKEHITNSSIEYIKALTKDVEKKIDSAKKVVYFTTEENFNKYTTIEEKKPETVITNDNNEQINVKDFSIWERWMYLLFKKQPEQ